MSEVKRYRPADYLPGMWPDKTGGYVEFKDYAAAQAELSALREELANEKARIPQYIAERAQTEQRLTSAEQRNETLAKAATEFMEYAECGWDHFPDVGVNLRAALAQPTESGASE